MRNIVLSKRMEAVVDMVPPQSSTVADVGCDHAYVSIALIKRNLAVNVIAMDVRKGPLEIAEYNIADQGLADKIELRLGDGFGRLLPDEADVIIIAGMGGLLIKRILEEGKAVLESERKRPCLILQPQSDLSEVRIFLQESAYHIVQEKMLVENGKYYTVMKALPGQEENAYNEVELLYGKVNLECRDEVLYSYLNKEMEALDKIINQMNTAVGNNLVHDSTMARWQQVRGQRNMNELARQYYKEEQDEMQ